VSYCRWSSDDHQCDVYVYESDRGFVTHVAANRWVFAEPMPDPVPVGTTETEVLRWLERGRAVSAILDRSTTDPIGLPHDGEDLTDPNPGACADRLETLRALGYRVPQFAIDALREEAS